MAFLDRLRAHFSTRGVAILFVCSLGCGRQGERGEPGERGFTGPEGPAAKIDIKQIQKLVQDEVTSQLTERENATKQGEAVKNKGNSTLTDSEFVARITKVQHKGKLFLVSGRKLKPPEEFALLVSLNAEVAIANFNKDTKKIEPGEPIPGGLTNGRFPRLVKDTVEGKPVTAHITVVGNEVTRILVARGKIAVRGKTVKALLPSK